MCNIAQKSLKLVCTSASVMVIMQRTTSFTHTSFFFRVVCVDPLGLHGRRLLVERQATHSYRHDSPQRTLIYLGSLILRFSHGFSKLRFIA